MSAKKDKIGILKFMGVQKKLMGCEKKYRQC